MLAIRNETSTLSGPRRTIRATLALALVLGALAVSASISWQHYWGHPAAVPAPQEPELETEPAALEVELKSDHRTKEPNASMVESRLEDDPTLRQLRPDDEDEDEDEDPISPTPAQVSICPDGMVLVDGAHCPTLVHRCRKYLSVERDRCQEYVPSQRCLGLATALRFCIDRFEFPNIAGVMPQVGMNYLDARELCRGQQKRLCTNIEWELACEGAGRLPYPYGYLRDDTACNIDRPYIIPDNDAYANPETREAEMARLDQREPSGARAGCVSSFGVNDLTGNVDEWVTNESGFVNKPPYRSGLKGGYWGPVRNRCRPMTTDHNDWHTGYQVGFRCCSDTARKEEPTDE